MILLQVLALQFLMGVLVENNLHLGVFLPLKEAIEDLLKKF